MTKKKIIIPNTPNRGKLDEAIDNWVSGEKTNRNPVPLQTKVIKKEPYARTTFQIPKELYKQLKKVAASEDKSVTKKLTEILEKNLPET